MRQRRLKQIISLAYYIAVFPLRLLTGRGSREILVYHEIHPEERESFGLQMDWMKNWVRFLSLEEIFNAGVNSAVALTFDDAFQSIRDHALPELKKRNIPCVIFVPTAWLGKAAGWEGGDWDVDSGQVVMSGEELKQLSCFDVVLQSHGHHHYDMTSLDEAKALEEYRESRRVLEEISNKPVRHLAYPFGRWNRRSADLCAAAGYERTYSALPSGVKGEPAGRIDVYPTDGKLELFLKCRGAYRWLPAVISMKRKLKSLLGK